MFVSAFVFSFTSSTIPRFIDTIFGNLNHSLTLFQKKKKKIKIFRQRRKPRSDRISEAIRASAVAKLQSSQESDNSVGGKDWQNDSWKTIPKDEKSWQLYKSAMDLWADVNQGGDPPCEDKPDPRYSQQGRRHFDIEDDAGSQLVHENRRDRNENLDNNRNQGFSTNPRVHARNSIERTKTVKEEYERSPQGIREYASDFETHQKRTGTQERPNPNQRNKSRDVEAPQPRYTQRRTTAVPPADDFDLDKQTGQKYGANEYRPNKYENKTQKYYDEEVVETVEDREVNNRGYQVTEREEKVENSESESEESTITMPESGRKVEHIAQKLEQAAQKYARGLSPSKFNDGHRDSSPSPGDNEDKFDKEEVELRNFARESKRKEYFEREEETQRSYERENNRNVERRASSRRFAERPRPPFEEAPEVPRGYRERRYSDKEEVVYGETGARTNRGVSNYAEKERGYESNFETKLERTKVVEKHSYQRIDQRVPSPLKFDKNGQKIGEQNDRNNNNTLQKTREKKIVRQSGGNLMARGFEFEAKSPKLVKRTKSFWRFRRDSDVLEGMALWQHRSLVDIPKMLKREEREREREREKEGEKERERSRKSTPENGEPSEKEIPRGVERPRDRVEEPKPAERIHKPEKVEQNYMEEFPKPAERPKATERSEYRMQREERGYFVGNISRKAIIENERKRSLEAKQNMVVAELKETNESKKTNERRKKTYGDDDDGLMQTFSETEASDEESTYSCIVVKDQVVAEKTLLPRTKLRKDSDRDKGRERERDRNTCGPWYDLWGVDPSVKTKKQ